jgi:hypothetical protein
MTEASLSKKILTLEMELKVLELQLKEFALKKKKGKNKFVDLYGIWKRYGDFSYNEIKESEIKLPSELY